MGRAAQAQSVTGARRVNSAKPDWLIKIAREVSKCLILSSEDNHGALPPSGHLGKSPSAEPQLYGTVAAEPSLLIPVPVLAQALAHSAIRQSLSDISDTIQ